MVQGASSNRKAPSNLYKSLVVYKVLALGLYYSLPTSDHFVGQCCASGGLFLVILRTGNWDILGFHFAVAV